MNKLKLFLSVIISGVIGGIITYQVTITADVVPIKKDTLSNDTLVKDTLVIHK